MRLAILFAVTLLAGSAHAASVVIPDSVNFFTDGQSQLSSHQLMVFQEPTLTEFTSFYFDSDFDPLASIPVLKNFNVNLDEGSDWYLVREGDDFTPQAIASGNFLRLVGPGPTSIPSATVDPGYWSNWPVPGVDPFPIQNWPTSFYLGFATSLGFDDYPERDIYGWVELEFYPFLGSVPNRLRMIGSATAFDSGGIVIGTLQAVPEPTALWIAAMGLFASGCRRRD